MYIYASVYSYNCIITKYRVFGNNWWSSPYIHPSPAFIGEVVWVGEMAFAPESRLFPYGGQSDHFSLLVSNESQAEPKFSSTSENGEHRLFYSSSYLTPAPSMSENFFLARSSIYFIYSWGPLVCFWGSLTRSGRSFFVASTAVTDETDERGVVIICRMSITEASSSQTPPSCFIGSVTISNEQCTSFGTTYTGHKMTPIGRWYRPIARFVGSSLPRSGQITYAMCLIVLNIQTHIYINTLFSIRGMEKNKCT